MSIQSRCESDIDRLEQDAAPDVVCLQELKCMDDAFPRQAIEDLGYNVAVHGRKPTMASLSSQIKLEDGDSSCPAAMAMTMRYLEAFAVGKETLRVASIYCRMAIG